MGRVAECLNGKCKISGFRGINVKAIPEEILHRHRHCCSVAADHSHLAGEIYRNQHDGTSTRIFLYIVPGVVFHNPNAYRQLSQVGILHGGLQ